MNIVTICLSVSVGATAHYTTFLTTRTRCSSSRSGSLAFMRSRPWADSASARSCAGRSKGKINPLIGSAGVSAVPMAARVSNLEGLRAKPGNYLLMHAMGPNVAGVIGSAVAAGFFMAVFGGGA